jgi:phosphate:Na+ symporter
MTRDVIFYLIGGLGLFFLGMKTMSDSLKKVAGDRLKNTLDLLTKRPIIGLLIGTAITCLIQSSSATSVMTVGFVNAGLLTLRQAISIILGANIGTTFTAWLISFFALFKITNYALPAIGVGFLLHMFGKTRSAKMWGQFILGFGLLFSGLGFLKDAFSPLKDTQALRNVLLTFGNYPLLGIMIGIGITMLLQSSSATIALLQIMAFSGLMNFQTCIPIILGDNIGTTITAQLAAIGTSTASRRTARAHALLNIVGVCYMFVPVYTGLYARFIERLVPGPVTTNNIMLHIALAHSTFNIINSFFIFLPLIGILEKLTIKLTRIKPGEVQMQPIYLEKHLLDTPPIALQQAVNEIVRMMHVAQDALNDAVKSFLTNNQNLFQKIREREDAVDNLQKEITQYLVELSQKNLEKSDAETIPVLLHSVNDVERVADHAINILELADRKIDQKLPFTGAAISAVNEITDAVSTMIEHTTNAFKNGDTTAAESALQQETHINRMQVNMKEEHIQRVNEGKCDLISGIVFIDFVNNMEKIGDHLTNIAQGVLRHLRWNMEMKQPKAEAIQSP